MFDRLHTEFKGHDASIYALEWDGDDLLLSGGADKVVASWSLKRKAPENFSVRTDSGVYSLRLTNHLLWIGLVNGDIHVIDRKKKEEIRHFQVHKKGVFHLERYGTTLISCGGDGSIGIWDTENLDLIRQIPLSNQKIRQARFSPGGKFLGVCCTDGTLRILETDLFNEIGSIRHEEGGVNTMLWTKDGMLSGGWDGHLSEWDRELHRRKRLPAHKFAIYDIISIGEYFVTASRDKRIKIWDNDLQVVDRLEYPKVPGHTRSVNRLLSMGLSFFASAGDDKNIKVWER